MMKLIRQIGTALATLQWLGCLWLTFRALSNHQASTALMATAAIAFTVFTDYFVWRVLRHA